MPSGGQPGRDGEAPMPVFLSRCVDGQPIIRTQSTTQQHSAAMMAADCFQHARTYRSHKRHFRRRRSTVGIGPAARAAALGPQPVGPSRRKRAQRGGARLWDWAFAMQPQLEIINALPCALARQHSLEQLITQRNRFVAQLRLGISLSLSISRQEYRVLQRRDANADFSAHGDNGDALFERPECQETLKLRPPRPGGPQMISSVNARHAIVEPGGRAQVMGLSLVDRHDGLSKCFVQVRLRAPAGEQAAASNAFCREGGADVSPADCDAAFATGWSPSFPLPVHYARAAYLAGSRTEWGGGTVPITCSAYDSSGAIGDDAKAVSRDGPRIRMERRWPEGTHFRQVVFYAPVWLVNKTGLPLYYAIGDQGGDNGRHALSDGLHRGCFGAQTRIPILLDPKPGRDKLRVRPALDAALGGPPPGTLGAAGSGVPLSQCEGDDGDVCDFGFDWLAGLNLSASARSARFRLLRGVRGANNLPDWSRSIKLDGFGAEAVAVHDKVGNFVLSAHLAPGTGLFARTRVVTLAPRYLVQNQLGRRVQLIAVRGRDVEVASGPSIEAALRDWRAGSGGEDESMLAEQKRGLETDGGGDGGGGGEGSEGGGGGAGDAAAPTEHDDELDRRTTVFQRARRTAAAQAAASSVVPITLDPKECGVLYCFADVAAAASGMHQRAWPPRKDEPPSVRLRLPRLSVEGPPTGALAIRVCAAHHLSSPALPPGSKLLVSVTISHRGDAITKVLGVCSVPFAARDAGVEALDTARTMMFGVGPESVAGSAGGNVTGSSPAFSVRREGVLSARQRRASMWADQLARTVAAEEEEAVANELLRSPSRLDTLQPHDGLAAVQAVVLGIDIDCDECDEESEISAFVSEGANIVRNGDITVATTTRNGSGRRVRESGNDGQVFGVARFTSDDITIDSTTRVTISLKSKLQTLMTTYKLQKIFGEDIWHGGKADACRTQCLPLAFSEGNEGTARETCNASTFIEVESELFEPAPPWSLAIDVGALREKGGAEAGVELSLPVDGDDISPVVRAGTGTLLAGDGRALAAIGTLHGEALDALPPLDAGLATCASLVTLRDCSAKPSFKIYNRSTVATIWFCQELPGNSGVARHLLGPLQWSTFTYDYDLYAPMKARRGAATASSGSDKRDEAVEAEGGDGGSAVTREEMEGEMDGELDVGKDEAEATTTRTRRGMGQSGGTVRVGVYDTANSDPYNLALSQAFLLEVPGVKAPISWPRSSVRSVATPPARGRRRTSFVKQISGGGAALVKQLSRVGEAVTGSAARQEQESGRLLHVEVSVQGARHDFAEHPIYNAPHGVAQPSWPGFSFPRQAVHFRDRPRGF